jgi:O-methyltransferase
MDVDASAAPHPGLAAAPAIRATGPGSGSPADLRRAYLDLLELALCDLVGTTTGSVGLGDAGAVASRELAGDQLRLRAAGMDWPLHGLTMVGLTRLHDLQACVESVVAEGIQGDLVEAGVWRGGASLLMRAALDALGDRDRTVVVADSFQGFPQGDGREGAAAPWSAMHYLGVPLEEVRASFARLGVADGVEFVPGFFQDTLPGLRDRAWSLVRLDGDTYEATRLALDCLYPGLAVGGHLIVDDFGTVEDCRRAVEDFRAEHGIDDALVEVDWTCVRWRRGSAERGPARAAPAGAWSRSSPPRPVTRPADARVPTLEEVALAGEVEELRRRLATAERELGRLRATPLQRARTRAARLLRRRA